MIGLDITGDVTGIIEKYPENIITAHRTTGEYDTILITRFKDTIELNQFLEILREEECINKTYTQLILNN